MDFNAFQLRLDFHSWQDKEDIRTLVFSTLVFSTIDMEVEINFYYSADRLNYEFINCGFSTTVFDPQLDGAYFITIAIVRSKWTLRFGDSSSTYKAFSSDCGLYAVDMSADKMKYFTVKDAAPLKQSGYLIGKLLLD